ncbi:hypothetical protein V7124_16555 [Neobacillus niacini]|uniref:hypothetical protein n=1 Tax=Neobacillus niacini TaxID=86668 RepID=UPI00300026B6
MLVVLGDVLAVLTASTTASTTAFTIVSTTAFTIVSTIASTTAEAIAAAEAIVAAVDNYRFLTKTPLRTKEEKSPYAYCWGSSLQN